jgi:hypothetical protein
VFVRGFVSICLDSDSTSSSSSSSSSGKGRCGAAAIGGEEAPGTGASSSTPARARAGPVLFMVVHLWCLRCVESAHSVARFCCISVLTGASRAAEGEGRSGFVGRGTTQGGGSGGQAAGRGCTRPQRRCGVQLLLCSLWAVSSSIGCRQMARMSARLAELEDNTSNTKAIADLQQQLQEAEAEKARIAREAQVRLRAAAGMPAVFSCGLR